MFRVSHDLRPLRPIAPIMEAVGKRLEAFAKELLGPEEMKRYDYSDKPYIDLETLESNRPMYQKAFKNRATETDSNALTLLPESKTFVGYTSELESIACLSNCTQTSIWYGVKVAENVSIGSNCQVLDKTILSSGVKIGEGSVIGAACKLGENSSVGKGCLLAHGVVVEDNVSLPDKSNVPCGTIITSGNAKNFVETRTRTHLEPLRSYLQDMAMTVDKPENERSFTEVIEDLDLFTNEYERASIRPLENSELPF